MKLQTEALPPAALAALFLLASGAASAAHELDLRTDIGYDSNVFELNESIGERGGIFSYLEAEFTAEDATPSGWSMGLDAGGTARLYESGLSDGDEEWYYVRVRGDSGGKRREHRFDWALRYRARDTTYVSRFTGMMATDGAGNSIGDRYDSSAGDLRIGWRFPGGSYGRISLEGSLLTKNYLRDYESLGLERLDYQQFGLQPEFALDLRNNRLRIDLTLGLRQYRDRRVDDISGNPVAGTDLEYRYYGIDARYEHALVHLNTLEFSGGYDIRKDNGVGFDDRTRWYTGLEWIYRPASEVSLSAGIQWTSRVFDRPATGDPTIVDETPEKKGYRLDAQFVRPFPGIKTQGVILLAEVWWESYENTNEVRFSYDRLVAYAGIRKEF